MSNIVEELDAALKGLAPDVAHRLERLVWDAIALADSPPEKTDANEWPEGYFERTAGGLAGQDFERPEQLPFEKREPW